MKTNTEIIQGLNRILANELVAINQHFLHARIFKNWGFGSLNSVVYKQSIRAMKEADVLIERILFLEGLPNMQKLKRLHIGEETTEMLQCDLELQQSSRSDLQTVIAQMEKAEDYYSRDLLEEILESCEDHIDWLEAQMDLIEKTGIQNYLQHQMSHEQ